MEQAASTNGRLAPILLLLAPAAMLLILLLRPVWDVDIFWQLKLGELILAHGGPITGEPFAAAHLGEPLAPVAWLGQAVLAEFRLLWGWTGLRIFDALCWLGGFWAIAMACHRRGAPPLALLIALVLPFVAALPTASIRPQSFAALAFGLLLALLRVAMPPWRRIALALPLFLLWQNLHPSVSLAALVLGAVAGLGWLAFLTGRRASPPWEQMVLALLAAAAIFATPAGWSILAVSAENARASVGIGASEWLPLWAPGNRSVAVPVLVTALLSAWLLLRNRQRIDWQELVPALLLLVMTLAAYRFVLFWAIAMVPVLARAVPGEVSARRGAGIAGMAALLGVAVAAPLLRPTHFIKTVPLAAIERLRSTGVAGTVFAHFPWGGPVIDAGYPAWRVAYDGRYYRYTPEEWERYDRIGQRRLGLTELDRIYHPAAYVLSPGWNAALIVALRADAANWQELSADRTAAIFVRRAVQRSDGQAPAASRP